VHSSLLMFLEGLINMYLLMQVSFYVKVYFRKSNSVWTWS